MLTGCADGSNLVLSVLDSSNLSMFYMWREGCGFYERYGFRPRSSSPSTSLSTDSLGHGGIGGGGGAPVCGPSAPKKPLSTWLQLMTCDGPSEAFDYAFPSEGAGAPGDAMYDFKKTVVDEDYYFGTHIPLVISTTHISCHTL